MADDWDAARETTRAWLKGDHSLKAGEWQYRWLKPRLLIEEFLAGANDMPPPDHKFFCFHGRVEFVAVDEDRMNNPRSSYFDRAFNKLPFEYSYPPIEHEVDRPACWHEMVSMAEALSRGEPFLRVDLYCVNGAPVCGELAAHPASGFDPFEPPEWDATFGALI